MASISSLLLKYLDELVQGEIQRFKSYLTKNMMKDFDPIPRSKLENADQIHIVELMVDQYDESGASFITVQILKQINKNKLARELEKELEGLEQKASGGKGILHQTISSFQNLLHL